MHKNYTNCFSKIDFYSSVYFTDCLDHYIHISDKNYPLIIYKIFYAEQVIKQIIKWINEEHSEYALAVVSDHGGQIYYGEDSLCNHGCVIQEMKPFYLSIQKNWEKIMRNTKCLTKIMRSLLFH